MFIHLYFLSFSTKNEHTLLLNFEYMIVVTKKIVIYSEEKIKFTKMRPNNYEKHVVRIEICLYYVLVSCYLHFKINKHWSHSNFHVSIWDNQTHSPISLSSQVFHFQSLGLMQKMQSFLPYSKQSLSTLIKPLNSGPFVKADEMCISKKPHDC